MTVMNARVKSVMMLNMPHQVYTFSITVL